MKPLHIGAVLVLPFSLIVTTCQAIELMRWERLPLAVPLLVGQERVVFVDRNVRVGMPTALGNRLRVQSASGAIYLRASEAVEPTRLQLQDAITGELILIDIAAENVKPGQSALEDIKIVESAAPKSSSHTTPDQDKHTNKAKAQRTPIPVVLTRYAAQNLYAPLRTVEPLMGVRRINVVADMPLELLLPGQPVHATALAAWRLDDYWVTAIRLTNQTQSTVALDPRFLIGNLATATFQHHFLGAQGTPMDTTVLYLTTRGQGLAKALLPTISPVDAAVNVPTAAMEISPEAQDEK